MTAESAATAYARVDRLAAEPWHVDRVVHDGDRLVVTGWSFPTANRHVGRDAFRFNGRLFDEVKYPLPRRDVGEVFWQRRGAESSGFECRAAGIDDPYPNGLLEVERVRDTPARERGRDSIFIPGGASAVQLPDEDRRFRVIGDRNAQGFLTSGATDYHRLDRAALAIAGKHLHEFDRVLDWGCGCGRVARHFPADAASRLIGCDIDMDNAGWSCAHLPGTYIVSGIYPPLPFGERAFDLIFGVSVFTHMREPLQHRWLADLARIAKPDCLVLMSVHGRTSIDFARLSPRDYVALNAAIDARGFVVTAVNPQIDGHAEHAGEYVDCFHSNDYVKRVWSRYFEVIDIIGGYIFTHDLVILRRRA